MKHSAFLLLMPMLLFVVVASAQNASSDNARPRWMHRRPTATNPSFKYEIVSASATSLDEARNKCLAELISSSGLSRGVVVSSDYKSKETLSQVWTNGKLAERVDYGSETVSSAKCKEGELFVENIDEYWTRDNAGTYYLTRLYAKSELGRTPLFDNVELTTRYGARGLWRSAIVPGWGQFHKGSNLKGGMILGGMVALVGGIVFTENQRADYVRRIGQTHNVSQISSYQTKRDHFATARNICIGAAAALYVYNLIDAVASPGARRVIVRKRHNGQTFAFLPAVSDDGTPVVVSTLTF
ncbi:MAG: hypothetical protein K2J00_05045 [Bacteroidaceae bacterium]|nr:hypothetical protein [Bacteroidaceae bacterium]